jgi:hypothetical protein
MGSVVLPTQSDSGDPLINEAGILPRADMIGVIDATWKDEVQKVRSGAVSRAVRKHDSDPAW